MFYDLPTEYGQLRLDWPTPFGAILVAADRLKEYVRTENYATSVRRILTRKSMRRGLLTRRCPKHGEARFCLRINANITLDKNATSTTIHQTRSPGRIYARTNCRTGTTFVSAAVYHIRPTNVYVGFHKPVFERKHLRNVYVDYANVIPVDGANGCRVQTTGENNNELTTKTSLCRIRKNVNDHRTHKLSNARRFGC